MDIYKNMKLKFEYFLFIAALGMAGCGAFFSIVGISTLFGSAMLSAGIMAGIIEFSKIIATTFLYRYWQKTVGFLRTYLALAIIVLILVTSAGIYGFLGSAFQKSSLEFKVNQEKIVMLESQKPFYANFVSQSENRMRTLSAARITQEARLSEAMTNAFLSRNPLQLKQLQEQTISLINQANEDIRTESGQMRTNQAKIMEINEQINTMKISSAGKKDIRTFQFVAEQFGTTLDKVAKYFIFIIIFVFDPMAIALILAYNTAVFKKPEISIQPEQPQKQFEDKLNISTKPEKVEIVNPIEIIQEPQSSLLNLVVTVSPTTTSTTTPAPITTTSTTTPAPNNGGLDPFYMRMFKM
jgi:hypothetical protein